MWSVIGMMVENLSEFQGKTYVLIAGMAIGYKIVKAAIGKTCEKFKK